MRTATATKSKKRSRKSGRRKKAPTAARLMKAHETLFTPYAESSDAFKILTMFDYSVPGVITDHS